VQIEVIHIRAVSGRRNAHSTFVPRTTTDVHGTKSGGGLVGNSSGASGLLTVVAAEPLLQAGLGTDSVFLLTLYGIPGSNYVLLTSSSPLGNWQSNLSMTLSNVANPIIIGGSSSNPPIQFYRAYRQ
jgi:hypothetical protein